MSKSIQTTARVGLVLGLHRKQKLMGWKLNMIGKTNWISCLWTPPLKAKAEVALIFSGWEGNLRDHEKKHKPPKEIKQGGGASTTLWNLLSRRFEVIYTMELREVITSFGRLRFALQWQKAEATVGSPTPGMPAPPWFWRYLSLEAEAQVCLGVWNRSRMANSITKKLNSQEF